MGSFSVYIWLLCGEKLAHDSVEKRQILLRTGNTTASSMVAQGMLSPILFSLANAEIFCESMPPYIRQTLKKYTAYRSRISRATSRHPHSKLYLLDAPFWAIPANFGRPPYAPTTMYPDPVTSKSIMAALDIRETSSPSRFFGPLELSRCSLFIASVLWHPCTYSIYTCLRKIQSFLCIFLSPQRARIGVANDALSCHQRPSKCGCRDHADVAVTP